MWVEGIFSSYITRIPAAFDDEDAFQGNLEDTTQQHEIINSR